MKIHIEGASIDEARTAAVRFLEKTKPKKPRGPAGTYRSTYGDTSGPSIMQRESWLAGWLRRVGILKTASGGTQV